MGGVSFFPQTVPPRCIACGESPFREAHRAVGALVREAEERGAALAMLPIEVFQAAHPRFDPTIYAALTAEAAVAARTAIGGTAPKNVARELAAWVKRLAP